MKKISLSVISGCGDCTACCTVFAVAGVGKAKGIDCKYLKEGKEKGCGIYNQRPTECVDFKCFWLQGKVENGALAFRPDKLGLIFNVIPDGGDVTGMLGVYRIGKGKLGPRAKGMLRKMEKDRLFFFEGIIYGPKHLLIPWIKALEEKKRKEEEGKRNESQSNPCDPIVPASQLPEVQQNNIDP